jgi:hypothetical protein
VSIEGVWIGNRIYWALWPTTRDCTLQITIKHKLVFSVTIFTARPSSGFQRRTLPFLGLSYQLLNWLSACRFPFDSLVGQNQSYVTTDGQSASLSWNKALIWGLRADLYYCQTVAGLLMWGALSDERTGLSFARYTVSSNKSVVSVYNLHFTCY